MLSGQPPDARATQVRAGQGIIVGRSNHRCPNNKIPARAGLANCTLPPWRKSLLPQFQRPDEFVASE